MKLLKWALPMALLLAGGSALAAPEFFHEKVSEMTTIQADPAKVWALLSDFNGMPRWNALVEKSALIDEDRETPVRTISLKDIGNEVDRLDERSDDEMTLRYHMIAGPWPVTRYSATLRVSKGAAAGTSVVEWRGSFDVKGTARDPATKSSLDMPPGPIVFGLDIETYNNSDSSSKEVVPDKTTAKVIANLYRTGLSSLKQVLER